MPKPQRYNKGGHLQSPATDLALMCNADRRTTHQAIRDMASTTTIHNLTTEEH